MQLGAVPEDTHVMTQSLLGLTTLIAHAETAMHVPVMAAISRMHLHVRAATSHKQERYTLAPSVLLRTKFDLLPATDLL